MKFNPIVNISNKLVLLCIICLYMVSCNKTNYGGDFEAPYLTNLGKHQLKISTINDHARHFFNQGLNLAYGFNHLEASRAFRVAIKQDPKCAMAYWGLALVLGPNINAPMDSSLMKEVYKAIQKASSLNNYCTDWENALINALSLRYPDSVNVNRTMADLEYASAMARVYDQFPNNSDIATLYAESLMDLHPWDLYDQDGFPKAWTPEITNLIRHILKRWPEHPGANHLFIHAMEASKHPQDALPSADLLRDLVPGSGHLVHMPSHIYIRIGRYHQGSIANEKAIAADSAYITNCRAQGIYPLAYYPHNIHFLAATTTLEGRGDKAISAAWKLSKRVDKTLMKSPAWSTLQHFYAIPYFVLVKFGEWDRILSIPRLTEVPLYPQAIESYARGMAHTQKGNLMEANKELAKVKSIKQDPSVRNLSIWDINMVSDIIEIAENVLSAEIAQYEGNYDLAIKLLYKAVALEDQLNYTEPPDWFFSIRHSLGATLLEYNQPVSAELVFREDLIKFPENGWALNGLHDSLIAQNKMQEAEIINQRFEKAWQWSNIELNGSEVANHSFNTYDGKDLLDDDIAYFPIKESLLCGS